MQSLLIRALGIHEEVDLDVNEYQLLHGDVLMLCTDGLTRMVSDEEIAYTLLNIPRAQAAAERLVTLANQYGGEDNVTVIVLSVLHESEQGSKGSTNPNT